MTSSTHFNCSKCNDTGYPIRRFYTDGRCCDCSVGVERSTWASLTAQEQNARAEAEAEARRNAALEARQARRASRG